MGIDSKFWRGKRVFLTGHTGFKGSWLALWLHELGAQISGYSLPPPTEPSLFALTGLESCLEHRLGDVRATDKLSEAYRQARPEIVFHMAAQPLISAAYSDPAGTFASNVMGTVNLLEAARQYPSVQAIVIVTTDKCYRNDELGKPFVENDPLGGKDPYSSSKACAELVSQAYFESFFQCAEVGLATARAGNVLGGGDWSAHRLIPDAISAFAAGHPVEIRRPEALRPWQHVIDALAGYLILAQALYTKPDKFSGGWNFGPDAEDVKPVSWVMDRLVSAWGEASWQSQSQASFSEAITLSLDSTKARTELAWQPQLKLHQTLDWTLHWYRGWLMGQDPRQLCLTQIHEYLELVQHSMNHIAETGVPPA
ncbi:MAG: CDP-glucose 4,6-dehydratase [Candidatus Melainabacteria bacterium HGW-Melainabacteria-1]|nr:MAG: CDP-glucose 4,6-dehydratase [Candidatus Melainabacteria bacterium HGW-Melainabacteria-1]